MPEVLEPHDTETAAEIARGSYDALLRMLVRRHDVLAAEFSPVLIGTQGLCFDASQITTVTATRMGLFARREYHPWHWVTSFGPPNKLPADNDPILCLTWGQFNKERFKQHVRSNPEIIGYFGLRTEIENWVGTENYDYSYAADSVQRLQTAYCPHPVIKNRYLWLRATPEEAVNRGYPTGQLDYDYFPPDMWEG